MTRPQDDSNNTVKSNCHISDRLRRLACFQCSAKLNRREDWTGRTKAGARAIPGGRHPSGAAVGPRRSYAARPVLPSAQGGPPGRLRPGRRRAPARVWRRRVRAASRGRSAGPDRSDRQTAAVRSRSSDPVPAVRICRRDRRCRSAPSGGRGRRSSTGSWSRPRYPRGGSGAPRSRPRGSGRRRRSAR